MSATYLSTTPQIQKLTAFIPASQVLTIGTNPVFCFGQNAIISYPLYMVINCTQGSTLYDFAALDYFQFISDVSNYPLFKSATYTMQTIQGKGPNLCYATSADGFKISSILSLPYDLYLTTNAGGDATQGDGDLYLTYYGLIP